MKARYLFACVASLGLAAGSASAQTADTAQASGLPDPATINVPDIKSGAELDLSNDPKYFYFHKRGVSFETAAYDVRECLSYNRSPNDTPSHLPGFAVLNMLPPAPKPASRKFVRTGPNQFGLVGAVLADIFAPVLIRTMQRRQNQAIMRMCMGYKGYDRYPTTREAYIALNEGDPMGSILIQAKIASGPKPDVESVVP